MQSNDELFVREFKQMLNDRRATNFVYGLNEVPTVPFARGFIKEIEKTVVYLKDIEEKFFKELNKTQAYLVGKATLFKRKPLPSGGFVTKRDGSFDTFQVHVPQDCVAIYTSLNIKLLYEEKVDGKLVKYAIPKGFDYVDFEMVDGKKVFIYIIPKRNVYKVNMTSLIITNNKHRIYYKGFRFQQQDGKLLYLYVTPYKYSQRADSRALCIRPGINYEEEIKMLVNQWVQCGLIFNPQLTQLDEQVTGRTNVGYETLEGTVHEVEYEAITLSMAEEKEDTMNFEKI